MGSVISVDNTQTPLLQISNDIDVSSILEDTYIHIKDKHIKTKRSLGLGIWFLKDINDLNPHYMTESEIILISSSTDVLMNFIGMLSMNKITICIKHDKLYWRQFSIDN